MQAIKAKKIAELEIKARKKLCACDYDDVAVKIAGSLLIIAKLEKRFRTPKSNIIELSYAICKRMFDLFEDEHLEALPFIEKPGSGALFSNISDIAFGDFQKAHRINYDVGVKPNVNVADEDLITHVAKMLVKIMPALTTELWECNSDIRKDAEIEAELEEFLGRNEIDKSNNALGEAMDIDDEDKLGPIIDKRMNEVLKRTAAKERTKQRKNSSGGPKNQEPMPEKNGRNGKVEKEKKTSKQRGRSKKRSSGHYETENQSHFSDNDSYYQSGRRRSKSQA